MTEEDSVMSVNPETLKSEPSRIYNLFSREASSTLEIRDDCGRKIRCTDDHPFLICDSENSGKMIWIDAGDLKVGDKLIVTHVNDSTLGTDFTCKRILEKDIELCRNAGLFDPVAAILARLGLLAVIGKKGTCSFYLGEKEDAISVQSDIRSLGFEESSIAESNTQYTDKGVTKYHTWKVIKVWYFRTCDEIIGS